MGAVESQTDPYPQVGICAQRIGIVPGEDKFSIASGSRIHYADTVRVADLGTVMSKNSSPSPNPSSRRRGIPRIFLWVFLAACSDQSRRSKFMKSKCSNAMEIDIKRIEIDGHRWHPVENIKQLLATNARW